MNGVLGGEPGVSRENLLRALKRVEANRGAPGSDGMTVAELRPYLREHWPEIKQRLDAGTYQPRPVRRMEIPKPDGGVRLLGIPTVLERRGHRFVRYADDGNIYVCSRRAGERVMAATPVVNEGLSNAYWQVHGLVSIVARYRKLGGTWRTAGCGPACPVV